jgi:hypothetical protein
LEQGRDYLDPKEVVERLRDEFSFCDADANQGSDDVGDMIGKLIELKAPQHLIDAAVGGRDRSFSVVVADEMDSDNCLSFIVQPDSGILIGYNSGQHEATVRPLVERCAQALDYEIRLI